MRQVIWLSASLWLLACSVDSDHLTNPPPDGGGLGGSSIGGAGGALDCPRCAPTGGTGGTEFATGGSGGAVATGGTPGTGGDAGAAGGAGPSDGGESCEQLESDYASALLAAKDCTPGAAAQCKSVVEDSLSCPGCEQVVNDPTMLQAIQTRWNAAGCGAVPHACPAIACVVPTVVSCVAPAPTVGPGASAGGTCTELPSIN